MRRRSRTDQVTGEWLWAAVMALTGAVALSCSGAESGPKLSYRVGAGATEGPGLNGIGNGASASGGASSSPGARPPEAEIPIATERPHSGDKFVYVANPASDTVAVINAETLAIRTVEVGDEPRYLETLGGKDVAIVLNTLSDDAHILRTAPTGETTAHRLEVLAGSNAIAVAPDGKHAVAYFDATRGIIGRTGSFQDVNLITIGADAAADASVGLSVGFRPSRVFFNATSTQAYVVTEDGVSVVDFAGVTQGGIPKTVQLAPNEKAKALDVSVTPEGRYALGRVPGESTLRLVDLTTGEITLLDVKDLIPKAWPSEPSGAAGMAGSVAAAGAASVPQQIALDLSDVDLAESGTFAVAVIRNLSTVVKIPVPGGFTQRASAQLIPILGETIGSVAITPNGEKALLFSTLQATTERLSTLDLATNKFTSQDLKKATRAVSISADSQTALVLHQKVAGNPLEPGIEQDVLIDRSFGYSLIKLDQGFAKLEITQSEVGPFSFTPDNEALFLLFRAPGVQEIQRVGLDNFSVTRIEVGSPPVSLGSVPKIKKMFVGQEHTDGRITFVDFTGKQVESVTGFEKNSRIRE